ncbi:MAG: redoxin family protein [Planctomycetales bacterium]
MPRKNFSSWVLRLVCGSSVALGVLLFVFPTSAAQPGSENVGPQGRAALEELDEIKLQVKLLDPSGKPAPGTQVGFLARNDVSQGEGWTLMGGVTADAQGLARLKVPESILDEYSLIAWHPEARLSGMQSIDLDDAEKPITMKLKPQCKLQGRVTSKQLDQAGLAGPIYVRIFHDEHEAMQYVIPQGRTDYEFYLPAGEYGLSLQGNDTVPHAQSLRITKKEKQHKVNDIDLPASRIALLRGRPAPELTDVVAWKNSDPINLADLHGKVVILDFWGYWCGPCVRSMPAMMQLHDRYAKQGLVIIGVHVPGPRDGVTNVQALERKVAGIKQSIWNGRDLPFPIALTKFHEIEVAPGANASNRVTADYGIDRFPSGILIDRRGNVVKDFSHHSQPDLALLQQLISEKPSAVSAR